MRRELERRVSQLEVTTTPGDCMCGQRLVVFLGDPEPEQKTCPKHGKSRVVRWPLGRGRLDTGATGAVGTTTSYWSGS